MATTQTQNSSEQNLNLLEPNLISNGTKSKQNTVISTCPKPILWCCICGVILLLIASIVILNMYLEDSFLFNKSSSSKSNPNSTDIPHFITHPHIDIQHIFRISRFRSSIGHDYTQPSNETCCSMKHYFIPKNGYWSKINLYAPMNGTISILAREQLNNSGFQIGIQSELYPDYLVTIFHVNINGTNGSKSTLKLGDRVTAGQVLGNHIGNITDSDVAVAYMKNSGNLLSLFEVINDDVFEIYQNYGIENRSQPIISQKLRNEYPLNCTSNGMFVHDQNSDVIANWVNLTVTANATNAN